MMVGSIFYNCWATLIAFTITFVVMVLQQSLFPFQILLWSFVVGILTFVAMFGIRFIVGYIWYTPNDELFLNVEGMESEELNRGEANSGQQQSTVEFNDEASEEIAKVVRSMMSYDDEPVTKPS